MTLHRVALGVALPTKMRKRTRRRSCRESRRARRTRSCGSRRRYAPMPLNEQGRLIRGQLAAVVRDRLARDRLQALGRMLPERYRSWSLRAPAPPPARRTTDILEPFGVFRQHAIDLRLLQHDLRHEDVIRVVRRPPRQVPSVAAYYVSRRVRKRRRSGGFGSGSGRAFGFVTVRFAGISYNPAQ